VGESAKQLITFCEPDRTDIEAGFSLGTFRCDRRTSREADAKPPHSFKVVTGGPGDRGDNGARRDSPCPTPGVVAGRSPRNDRQEGLEPSRCIYLTARALALNGPHRAYRTGSRQRCVRREDRDGFVLFDLGSMHASRRLHPHADPKSPPHCAIARGENPFRGGGPEMKSCASSWPPTRNRVHQPNRPGRGGFTPNPASGRPESDGTAYPSAAKLWRMEGPTPRRAAARRLIPCAHVYPTHPLAIQLGRKRPRSAGLSGRLQPCSNATERREQVAIKRRSSCRMAGRAPSEADASGRSLRARHCGG